ncbi:flippase-like domain-containing protein [Bifidobacterium sp. 82T24]|uniref:lysylphosphatidylglycerol synthase transmembrane domain-containing protein n=1 Tax=Bifidobacterium pluvialisilvae TaxID=2834436 RepID=UPI001C58B689|nr:lysylphosphatidylglycerol synthase transmembrane domain-containing protein [Bifidobacterium pluvialisilvae]MBW3087144.1 flippase-like domain-containing protein [Bifidobacterium pluvialisilvae]
MPLHDNGARPDDPVVRSENVAPSADASDAAAGGDVSVSDVPPTRVHDFSDLVGAACALAIVVLVMLGSVYLTGISSGVASDVHHAGTAVGWLVELPLSLLQQIVTVLVVVSVLIQLLVSREWVQAIVSIVSMFLGYGLAGALSIGVGAFGPHQLVAALDSTRVLGHGPLLPDMFAGLAAFLTSAGPHRLRGTVKWGWNTIVSLAVLLAAISVDPIAGIVVALASGRLIGLLVRFVMGTQNKGAWGMQIVQALSSIGLETSSLIRREGIHGPAGAKQPSLVDDLAPLSRIYKATARDGSVYVVSVRDEQTRTVGYLSQLWQWLRMASGVDLRTDRSMSATTHHHVDLLLTLRNIGLETPEVYGRAEVGESSIVVFAGERAYTPVDWDDVDDDDLIDVMGYLGAAHARGITHRAITPQSFARSASGRLVLAGWQNGDDASSSVNIAIDRIQLLTALSCRTSIARVIACAERCWGVQNLVALVPFVQNVAVPPETKSDDFWSRQTMRELRDGLGALAPAEETEALPQVTLSRFNARSVIMLALVIVAAVVVFTQLNMHEVISAVSRANPWMAAVGYLFGLLSWVGSAVALYVYVDRDHCRPSGILAVQAASGFTTISMPAGVGPAFVMLQYLRKSGYRNSAATAITSAIIVIQALAITSLLLVIGVFTGRDSLSGMIPTNTLVTVIGLVAAVISLVMIVPYTRRLILDKAMPVVLSYARQLVDLLSQPRRLLIATAGWVFQTSMLGMAFWASLMAFGQYTNPLETVFIYVLTNTLAAAVPTPGGLGAIEAALTLGFTSVGIPSAVALSSTMLFRLLTYWLRIPIGALSMKWMNSRELL